MTKKTFIYKFWLVAGISLILVMPCQDAFAWGGSISPHHRDEIVAVRGKRYHYREGRFHRPSFFGLFVVRPQAGTIITALPAGRRTIIAGGTAYYYYDNVYYTACPSGYIVVPAPAVNSNIISLPSVATSETLPGETQIINIPNSKGTYTPVKLVKYGNGYIGPQGEYYAGNPPWTN